MSSFTLLLGVTLPWAAGSAGLFCLAKRAGVGIHWTMAAGHGFFLGYALLFAVLKLGADWAGDITFWSVAAVLALTSLGGFLCSRSKAGPGLKGPVAVTGAVLPTGGARRALAVLLLAWMSAHLLAAALDIVTIPLFPWDAWTVWVYRAKAWFLAGGLFGFLPLREWLQAGPEVVYAVPAAGYPLLPSVVPYWAALSLGQWHEVLVNVPVWLCGLSIVLAFHAQCRAQGLGPLVALGCTYVLASTPLFGVHHSLGGYADIWMAGFAGLGLLALLRGLIAQDRGQLILGFAMLILGLLVKVEGVVWLCAGLLLFLITTLSGRILLGMAAAMLLAVTGLFLLGWTFFELPVVGAVGVRDGMVHVPLAGAHALEIHDVGWSYLSNAFTMGSWNLAWILVSVALLAALGNLRVRACRIVIAFLLVFTATQAAVFVFSEAGAWAETQTAINRLPLQAWPALLFAVAVVFQHRRQASGASQSGVAGKTAGGSPWPVLGVFTLAGFVTLIACLAWLKSEYDAGPSQAVEWRPADLNAVVGNVRKSGDHLVADGYANGFILLSSGPVDIDSSSHYLLRAVLDIDRDVRWPEEAPAFFWRSSLQAEQVSRVTLDGAALVDLSISEDWRGRISEIGLLFPEHGGRPAVLEGLKLEGPSLGTALELLPGEWFEFEPWSQRSANLLWGGAPEQKTPLTLLVCVWVSMALLTLAMLPRRLSGPRPSGVFIVVLVGWMLLDVRWTVNRVRQAQHSWQALTTQTVDERIADSDYGGYYPWLSRVREELLGGVPARVLLVRDPAEFEYYAWRSKYQLLPHSVALQPRLHSDMPPEALDYVLFLGPFARGDGPPSPRGQLGELPVSPSWAGRLELVDLSPEGILYRVRKDSL